MFFFVDWEKSTHPAHTTLQGCSLTNFTVTVPDAENYRSKMSALGIDVIVVEGPAGLTAELTTPNGLALLQNW